MILYNVLEFQEPMAESRFTSADWSTYFDGVLVIREEVAPVFEERR